VINLAERARFHHALVRGLVDRVVVALVADLEQLVVPARGVRHGLVALARLGHHLLAQHVLAGVEASGDDLGVHPQRRRGDDRLEVLVLEHVLVFDVVLGGRLLRLVQHLVCRRQ